MTRGGRLAEAARAAAGPAACAAALIGLLSAWVTVGGAGTLTPVRIRITLAAVPQRAFTPQAAGAVATAHTFLTIRNLASTPDELIAVRSTVAWRVVLVRRSVLAGQATVVSGLPIPAHGTLSLTPLTDDAVLDIETPFEDSPGVLLTLVFRHAGQVTIDAPVTAPGTP